MAASRLIAPVGMASTRILFSEPSRMIEPLPQLFSICAIARFNAFFLSSAIVEPAIRFHLLVERSAILAWLASGYFLTACVRSPEQNTNRSGFSSGWNEAECVLDVADPNDGVTEQ